MKSTPTKKFDAEKYLHDYLEKFHTDPLSKAAFDAHLIDLLRKEVEECYRLLRWIRPVIIKHETKISPKIMKIDKLLTGQHYWENNDKSSTEPKK